MNGFGSEQPKIAIAHDEAGQLKYGIIEAVTALADMGDPDSLACLKRLDALLQDDYTGSGLWEAIDAKLAEIAAS